MKRICIPFWLFAVLACFATAQTGTAAPATNAPSFVAGDIEIFSRSLEYDMRTNVVLFMGNVRVVEARMQMTCERLTARLPERGGHIESVIAEQDVTIDLTDDKGQKVHGTSDKLIYSYKASATGTNEQLELTGNPMLDTTQGTVTGDIISYDRITGRWRATNQRMVIRQQNGGSTNNVGITNTLLPKEPPAPKDVPAPKIDPPPKEAPGKPSSNWPP